MCRGSTTASERVPGIRSRPRRAALLLIALLSPAIFGPAPSAAHPLDALSASEIDAAMGALRAAGHADRGARFPLITLAEPDKAAVLAWPGQPVARKAFVIARQDRTVYEGFIDLASGKIERWDPVPGVQPAISLDELKEAQRVTIADPEWQAAMQRRGYAPIDPGKLFCAPMPAGSIIDPAEQGRRLVRVTCFDAAGTKNVWSRPIEGLLALVDLDERKVIRVIDTGAMPVSRDAHAFDGAAPKSAPPLKTALENAHVTIDEAGLVHWRQWSLHYRLDRRGGLIVSLLRYRDGERDRMVLYRGSLAEMFVPYMDADPNWAFRAWFDVGENDFGFFASPLKPGIDCPAGAAFVDAVLANSRGEARLGKSVICLFERDTGAPLWRHAEGVNAGHAGRPALELVLRTIETLGNYDYIIDWVLNEAGAIRIDVGASGIDMVKGVAATKMSDAGAAKETASGALVAPNLVAVNHDHFLSFRLDLDIDDAPNTLLRQKLMPQSPQAGDHRGRSLWRVVDEPVREEGAMSGAAHGGAEVWRIVNPNVTNALGQNPGYELRLGHAATSLLAADDPAQRRGAFSAAPLWVTAYDPRELYAAGPYPNQSRGGDGLPAYAARHRPVENADIVLWATLGFHHVTRPEDWPVLPTQWHSLSLVPAGFFDRNPTAVSLPKPGAAGR
jgi:primary-amine oxidase